MRALPLVAVMWLVTGLGVAAAALGPQASAQPTAPPGHVVMLQMLWMTAVVCAAFLRYVVAPAEIEKARRRLGAENALERAESLQDAMWYVLGLTPFVALLGLMLTGWALGAAAMWVASLAAMLVLAPDPAALQQLAVGGR